MIRSPRRTRESSEQFRAVDACHTARRSTASRRSMSAAGAGGADVHDTLAARWGEPARRATFRTLEHEVAVYKWAPEATGQGVTLYVTHVLSPPARQRHRTEFFAGFSPEKDEVASPLAALALSQIRQGEEIGHGHTVPAPGPLWTGTGMRRFLVMRPRTEIIPDVSLSDGSHVAFLQAIPIHDEEADYKTAHDAEALIRGWEKRGVAFWDPGRPGAVPVG